MMTYAGSLLNLLVIFSERCTSFQRFADKNIPTGAIPSHTIKKAFHAYFSTSQLLEEEFACCNTLVSCLGALQRAYTLLAKCFKQGILCIRVIDHCHPGG